MSPRRKRTKVTIKSKEVQALLGLLITGAGITLSLVDTIEGVIPELLYAYFGEGIIPLGVLLVLWGLRFLRIKQRFNDNKVLFGVFTLSMFWITLLAYFNHVFETDFNPGILGTALHEYLWNFLGTILEGITLLIVFLQGLALIFGSTVIDYLIGLMGLLGKVTDVAWRYIIDSAKKFIRKGKEKGRQLIDIQTEELPKRDSPNGGLETDPAQKIYTEPQVVSLEAQRNTAKGIVGESLKGNVADTLADEQLKAEELAEEIQHAGKVTVEVKDILHEPASSEDTPDLPDYLKRFYDLYKERFKGWKPGSLPDIFLPPVKEEVSAEEIEEVSKRIEQVLESFKIHAKVTKVFVGPSVIEYAVNLATGVKVAKVRNLAKDIALAIAAPSESIRVEPIAGTSLIGIEVPRKRPRMVRIIEIIDTAEFKNPRYKLPLAIGKDIHGKPVILDLYDMPHLLIAGATGSGKSVAINSIVAGLLTRFTPDELKLIMVDPKMVEMEPYNGVPHLLTPVITDMNQTGMMLDWLIFEMEERYKLFKQFKTRNLSEYNAQAQVKLPYIVLIIDEMADLILTKKSEVENKIVRLAQLARATGIHLILATQRPSVNVITGLIKANIPARIALAVASGVDSRVILDQVGAENLLGKGDMLIKTPNQMKLRRVQGAFISTDEVNKLTSFMREQVTQFGYKQEEIYPEEVLSYLTGNVTPTQLALTTNADPLLKDAIELVVKEQKVSASGLQRYLKIGFNRAARLIDEMEKMGIVSPLIGNRRKVLINSLEELDL